ncbi:SDR family oxidoreductase [Cupriavidus sp. D39]|uniref:SDR family oxidoreductase n=1 Tax=Cupriavidus sp. D39 TaxID=2997877 RepID=UPI002D1E4A0B|nr:SDR family oxidoreductase [Cupriavidus sp. D39]
MALVGWSRTLAREVGRDGITCNIVPPGRIATQRIRFLDEAKAKREGHSVDSVAVDDTEAIALGRYGKPKEYADVVTSPASSLDSSITGSTIRICGCLIASV